MNLLNLKFLSIAGGITIAFIIAVYFYGYTKGGAAANTEWEVKLATAPVRSDTVERIDTIYLPPQSGSAQIVRKPTRKPAPLTVSANDPIDSILTRCDSIHALLWEYASPFTTAIQDSAIGTLWLDCYPESDSCGYTWIPAPLFVPEREITNTREILIPRPWYELPAYIGGTAIVTWLVVSQIK